MKRTIISAGILYLFCIGLWSCSESNSDDDQLTLRGTISNETLSLNQAISEIQKTPGYQLLTMGEDSEKSVNTKNLFSATITIDKIKGVYDYQLTPDSNSTTTAPLYRYFTKTGESDQFIVRMPKEKAYYPGGIYDISEEDSLLVNDFVITTSDYLYQYNGGLSFNYLLDTKIDIADQFAGALRINWAMNSLSKLNYSASYNFSDEYSIGIDFQTGDTISYIYTLTQAENTLYQELITLSGMRDSLPIESEYALIIGDLEIIRNSSSESVQVYKDGVLQENATVEMISNTYEEEYNISFCHMKRDIKITFDDGSSIILSELIGDSLETLDTLFESLREVYFATHLVNRIALNISNNAL